MKALRYLFNALCLLAYASNTYSTEKKSPQLTTPRSKKYATLPRPTRLQITTPSKTVSRPRSFSLPLPCALNIQAQTTGILERSKSAQLASPQSQQSQSSHSSIFASTPSPSGSDS